MWVVVLTFIVIAGFDMKGMSPGSINIPFLMAALLMVLFLAVAIKMLSYWRKSREDYQILMREKVETELKFLKTQLNPHFLFNTLNNLYYLSSEKSDKAPKAILALSELLDYVINETKVEFVGLDKELKLLENYIELEKLRYEDRLKLKFEVVGEASSVVIAPMLLLSLVENAFKHGAATSMGQHWIVVRINCQGQSIKVEVSNSREGSSSKERTGIGLTNFQHQLKLLYPGRHTLKIIEMPDSFAVNLELS
jgi:LytS/YehU family sensor histidine kinase